LPRALMPRFRGNQHDVNSLCCSHCQQSQSLGQSGGTELKSLQST